MATGGRGKIYRLAGDPARATLIARADAQQVTALATDRGGQVLFATSNPGKVFRLSAARAERGTFTSEVRDAQTVATWGAIKWQGLVAAGTRVEVSTRSGNTRTPDEAWSDWSAPYAAADGSAITSPRARYLQWRAVLVGGGRGEAPLLTSLTAAYLPRNARPRVTSITVHTPGTVYQRPFPTGEPEIAGFDGDTPDRRAAAQVQGGAGGGPNLGRRAYEKGLLTFIWRAEDENRDDLTLRAAVPPRGRDGVAHAEAGAHRRDLRVGHHVGAERPLHRARAGLGRAVQLRRPRRSPATSRARRSTSTTRRRRSRSPSARRDGARTVLAFDVRDDNSAVLKVEYSLDGDRWQTVYPKDGIADSRVEQFELTLPEAEAAQGRGRCGPPTRSTTCRARAACSRRPLTRPRRALRRSLIRAAAAGCSCGRSGSWRPRPAGSGRLDAAAAALPATGRDSGMPRSTGLCDAFTVVRANSHTMFTATT